MRRGTSCRTLLLALVSCSSSSAPAQAVDAGAESGPPACTAQGPCTATSGTGTECVSTVRVKVVTSSGGPAASVPVFVCGTNVCSAPTSTASDGSLLMPICLDVAKPAIKIFDDPKWVPFASLLLGAGPSFDVSITVTPLPAGGSVLATGNNASGGVTLAVSGAPTFDLEHTTATSQVFRAASFPLAAFAGTGLDPGPTRVAFAWGLAPLNTKLAPPAKLSVPNAPSWPAGAAVDVLLDGTDTTTATPPAPWGTWGVVASAHVSADGSTIATDAASGLPEVAPVAFRLH
ncbi:MAG TPA: hypothetical protein VF765_19275 [Polyangiaceae bacterium]